MPADDLTEPSWLGGVALPPIDLGFSGAEPDRRLPLLRRRSSWLIVAGGIAGLFAPGHPTAVGAADIVLRAIVAMAFVVAASRARRRAALVSSVLVAVAFGGGVAIAASRSTRLLSAEVIIPGVAVVGAIACAALARASDSHIRWVAGLAGGLCGQAALRLPTSLPARTPSAVAFAALLIVVLSGWPNQSRRNRRWYRRAAWGVFGVAGVATAGGALSLLAARNDVTRGVNSARDGLAAARRGDTTAATPSFITAQRALRAAHDEVDRWYAWPARAVPVVGQHMEVVRRLTGTAAKVTETATETLDGAQLQSFRAEGGRLDVQRMRTFGERMVAADDALRKARTALDATTGPWLVPIIANRSRTLDAQLRDAQRTTRNAREVLSVVPTMLGADGPRRYLLVVGNPAEARGSGGVIGNFGELTAVDGKLSLARFGRTQELNSDGKPGDQRRITGPADYVAAYAPDGEAPVWSNVNISPDFPSVAAVMAQLYPQSGGQLIDGVVSADPVALASLLRLTGPVRVDSWPQPISADNAAKLLMFDLYAAFGDVPNGRQARIGLLGDVSQAVWKALTTAALPAPATMTATLNDAVAGRHLQLWSARPDEEAYLDRIGVSGSASPRGGDLFGVMVNNATASKIEWFLERTTSYRVSLDPATGAATATATVVLHNTAPGSGLATDLIGNQIGNPVGSTSLFVSAYSAGKPTSATIDGKPFDVFTGTELGRHVQTGWVYLAAGESATLRFTYRLDPDRSGSYRLALLRQPTPRDADTVDVHVSLPPGWRASTVVGMAPRDGGYGGVVSAVGPRLVTLSGFGRAAR